VSEDDRLWDWFNNTESLLIGYAADQPEDQSAHSSAVYCPRVDRRLHRFLLARLADAAFSADTGW
jgi:hypothetical protein